MDNELYDKWDKILEHLKLNFNITDVSYRTFIKQLSIFSVHDNKLTVMIDDIGIGNSKSFIEQKYGVFLQVSIEELTGVHYDISYISKTEYNPDSEKKKAQKEKSKASSYPLLNPKYTFNTFVVGDNNDYAHAASLKVAEDPGDTYNPLFIYGGAGLGKTHLMHAIANYIIDHNEHMKVVYVTSETFVNEIVTAIRDRKDDGFTTMQEFRDKYRNVDVLLIDDIQFIIGKETMQQEFFHTFNHLYESQKQIVISSDKHPATMKTLEERLRSRFEMGLTVDIKAPTYETRLAILRQKMQEENISSIDNSILDYIASNVVSNIRELQGAITKVIAFSKLRHKEITMELAKEALADMINPNVKRKITIDFIIETVADHFGITIKDILSTKRSSNIVFPRQICMYLCRQLTNSSLQEIGAKLGKRHHTTILHGSNTIETMLNDKTKNEELARTIDVLIKKINPQ